MAKVAFSKLKCKLNDTEIPVQIGKETIMVKQYLPLEDKLLLIETVLTISHDEETDYTNPVLNDALRDLYVVFKYSNLSFTEKQKDDLLKLYDTLKSSGILDQILAAIPENEYATIVHGVTTTADAIYRYRQSVLGILETVKDEYDGTEFDLNKITETLQSDDIALLKNIITNLN